MSAACREHGLKLHVDGARIFNAAIATGTTVPEYTQHVDSVMFCISKGLSAPVGSLLCGSRDFIDRAYRMRKRLGGAMRQAGIVAAAGIVALEQMTDRLAEDHAVARELAAGLGSNRGRQGHFSAATDQHTQGGFCGLRAGSAADLVAKWKARGVLCNPRPPQRGATSGESARRASGRQVRGGGDPGNDRVGGPLGASFVHIPVLLARRLYSSPWRGSCQRGRAEKTRMARGSTAIIWWGRRVRIYCCTRTIRSIGTLGGRRP